MNELWRHESYLTMERLITNTTIIEYDLKSANTSVAKEFGLLPDEMINKLNKLPKKERNVKLGLYKKDHKEYNEKERAAFMQARKLFFDANKLEDHRIVAIKKDAIFVEGVVSQTQITKNLLFREKSEYTSYLFLKPLEIFYSGKTGLDIKRMNMDIYNECHKDYFGSFVFGVLRGLEIMSRKDVLRYIRNFFDNYKWLKLDPDYYRQFSPQSKFVDKEGLMYDICVDIGELDISYNMKLILEILSLLL